MLFIEETAYRSVRWAGCQKTSLPENCATLGLIGDSVAAELLIDPNPAEETVLIGLLRLSRLIVHLRQHEIWHLEMFIWIKRLPIFWKRPG